MRIDGDLEDVIAEANAEVKDDEPSNQVTYTRDKKHGGYLIRLVGPGADNALGHKIPVTRKDGTKNNARLPKAEN